MITRTLVLIGILAGAFGPLPATADPLFKDGLLGLTQAELRAKLGPPPKVRVRMAAQRVYKYHSFDTWENVLKDQMSGTMGEDVYEFTRERVVVRYAFQYAEDRRGQLDTPTLVVTLVDIEFLNPEANTEGPVSVPYPVPIAALQKLVPEFSPSVSDDAPTYRSNLFIILLQPDQVSPKARQWVTERSKDDYDWTLAYRLYTSEGFPSRVTLNDTVSRMEFSIESVQFIKDRLKLTHDAVVNPFSPKAASLPPSPEPVKKAIPRPRYAP